MRTLFAAFALSVFMIGAVPCKWCADHHGKCAACKQTHKNCSTCHDHHNGCKDACNK